MVKFDNLIDFLKINSNHKKSGKSHQGLVNSVVDRLHTYNIEANPNRIYTYIVLPRKKGEGVPGRLDIAALTENEDLVIIQAGIAESTNDLVSVKHNIKGKLVDYSNYIWSRFKISPVSYGACRIRGRDEIRMHYFGRLASQAYAMQK